MSAIIEKVRSNLKTSRDNMAVGESVTTSYSPLFMQIAIKHLTGRTWTLEDLNYKKYGFENMDSRLAEDIGEVLSALRSVGIMPKLLSNGGIKIKINGYRMY